VSGGETAPVFPIFSVMAHVVEPKDMFSGRLPRRWADRAPRVVDIPDGYGEQWVFEDRVRPIRTATAAAGLTEEQLLSLPNVRYSDIREGCYDPRAALADMDIVGVVAAVYFSSPGTFGFGGDLFAYAGDPELSNACVRAWNDWAIEDWAAADPRRLLPTQLVSYLDPDDAAAEVERNAARGFKAVTFRNPTDLGLPTIGSGHWDRFLRVCEESNTVICHHTEGRAFSGVDRSQLSYGERSTLFQASAMDTLNSWLWGGLPVRFPGLKVLIGESGGSWLPHHIRRLDWELEFSPLTGRGWPDPERTPVELIRQSFVFSTLEIDTAIEVERSHGISGWMLESDYPHIESNWPHTQEHYEKGLEAVPPEAAKALAYGNAERLFRHDVSDLVQGRMSH
jgi:predicted TIM-barrel fold metal-dependent hydrolase